MTLIMTHTDGNYCKHLKEIFENQGGVSALNQLASDFRQQERYHELFEVLQAKARVELGLPLSHKTDTELTAEQQAKLQEHLLLINREVGTLLAQAGKLREAWTYLETANDPKLITSLIEATEITDDNFNEIIEITLMHKVSPVKGFELFLQRLGILYSVSMYQSICYKFDLATRQAIVTQILEHAYHTLRAYLATALGENADIVQRADSLMEVVDTAREQILATGFHIPKRLIVPVFRIGRILRNKQALTRLAEMAEFACEFGEKLTSSYYKVEAPFEDSYRAHWLFFRALGADDITSPAVTAAIEYFDQQSTESMENEQGPACHLVLIDLLYRLGNTEQALNISLQRLSDHNGISAGDIVLPSVAEMAKETDNFQLLQSHYAEQNNAFSYLLSLLQQNKH